MRHILLAAVAAALLVAVSGISSADKPAASPRRIAISLTEAGFKPDAITVDKAKPVVLVFTRKTDKTCAKEIVVELGGDKKVEKKLPLDKPVEIAATFARTGKLTYGCGMNMVSGVISVE